MAEDASPGSVNGGQMGRRTPSEWSPHVSKPAPAKLQKGSSERESVVNMVNGMLGAAMLSMPFCTKQMGLFLLLLVVLAAAAVNRVSQQLMISSGNITGKMSYEGIAHAALGPAGRIIIKVCTLGVNFGCLVAFINIISDVLSSVAGSVIPPGAEPTRQGIMICIVFLGMIPLSVFVSSPEILGKLSFLSVSLILFFTGVMITYGMTTATHSTHDLVLWNLDGLPLSFPIIAFAFSSQTILFQVVSNMRTTSLAKMERVIDQSMLVCGIVYLCCGAGGYAYFRDRVSGDILRNLGAGHGVRAGYERLLKLAYGCSVLSGVPLVLLPIDSVLMPYFVSWSNRSFRAPRGSIGFKKNTLGKRSPVVYTDTPDRVDVAETNDVPGICPWHRPVLAILLLITALIFAIKVPNMEFIFGLVGSTSIPILAYFMPGFIYISLTNKEANLYGSNSLMGRPHGGMTKSVSRWKAGCGVFLMVLGVISLVVCTSATLRAVNEEAQVVEVTKELVTATQLLKVAVATEIEAKELAKAVTAVDVASREFATLKNSTDVTAARAQQASTALMSLEEVTEKAEKPAVWDIGAHVRGFNDESKRSSALEVITTELAMVKDAVGADLARVDQEKLDQEELAAIDDVTAKATSMAGATEIKPPEEIKIAIPNKPSILVRTDTGVEVAKKVESVIDGENEVVAKLATEAIGTPDAPEKVASTDEQHAIAAAKIAQAVAEDTSLTDVLHHANITRSALQASVDALKLVDDAALALSQAQKAHDPKKAIQAIQGLQHAIDATMDTSSAVNSTMEFLEQKVANQTMNMQRLLVHMLGEINSGLEKPTSDKAANIFWHAHDTPMDQLLNGTTANTARDPTGSLRGSGTFTFGASAHIAHRPEHEPSVNGSDDVAEQDADTIAAVQKLEDLARNITNHVLEVQTVDAGIEADQPKYLLSTLVQAAIAAEAVATETTAKAQTSLERIIATTDPKYSTRAAQIAEELQKSSETGRNEVDKASDTINPAAMLATAAAETGSTGKNADEVLYPAELQGPIVLTGNHDDGGDSQRSADQELKNTVTLETDSHVEAHQDEANQLIEVPPGEHDVAGPVVTLKTSEAPADVDEKPQVDLAPVVAGPVVIQEGV